MEFLRDTVFAKKFHGDDKREPSLFLELPNNHLGRVGLVGLEPMLWVQLLVIVLLLNVVNVGLAIVTYHLIVQKKQKQEGSAGAAAATAYLVGYGVVCPFLCIAPFVVIEALDLHNLVIIMAVSNAVGPNLMLWRCLEAMHGTVPASAVKDLGSYISHFKATVLFALDRETGQVLRASRRDIVRKAISIGLLYLQLTVLYSILYPVEYNNLFRRGRDTFSLLYIISPGNIINNYMVVSLMDASMEVGATGEGLIIALLSGVKTLAVNLRPLTKSQSVSDFLGQRWNRVVSGGLRRGVYAPMRKSGFSRPVASLVTFLASGLMHEYILILMSYREIVQTGRFPFSGRHLVFFLWNGVLLILEHILRDTPLGTWMSKNLPSLVKTILVMFVILALAKLGTQTYVDVGLYTDLGLGFPRLIWFREQQHALE